MHKPKKDFNYFYDRKPTEWNHFDTMDLHIWMEWIKPILLEGIEKQDIKLEKVTQETFF